MAIPPRRPEWPAIWLTVADGIAQRSLCTRDKVGAVIVSPDNTPITANYNGPSMYFPHNDRPCTEWCPRAMKAQFLDGVIEFLPEMCAGNTTLSPIYEDCPALHAEANAISRSSHVHRKGGTIYVTSDVCYPCAKLISNSGIIAVVVDQRVPRPYRNSQKSYDYLTDLGIYVTLIKTEADLFA